MIASLGLLAGLMAAGDVSAARSRTPSTGLTVKAATLADELPAISTAAQPLNRRVEVRPRDEEARQGLADLAIQSARALERALARGDEPLARKFRQQFETHFLETRWRLARMAERGNGSAEFALGVLALHGVLDPVDVALACRHFSAALGKGFAGARFRHAQCIEGAQPERSHTLLREAAQAGHPGAMEVLARQCLERTPSDWPCARQWLERSAREGRASAATLLGWSYAQGVAGAPDLEKAAAVYREAAEAGDAGAQNNLAELLENGRGIARDEAAAFAYYRRAAEAGFTPAQFNLGRVYAAGRGIEKSLPSAREWLEKALQGGIPEAQRILDLIASGALD